MIWNFDHIKEYNLETPEENRRLEEIKQTMNKKESFLDWLDVETCISFEERKKISLLSEEIRKEADVFVVIGIGGSYLGSRAVIEALSPYFKKNNLEIIFAGQNLSASYLKELLAYLENKNVFVNVISKSGGTLEPSIAFDTIYKYMQENFTDYKRRVIVTTDKEKGKLKEFATKENLQTFVVPDNIGGRYSVLSAVGLLPISVSGISIDELLEGARSERNCFEEASRYALIRKHLEEAGRVVEAITIYEPKLASLSDWSQQLFAETQGKNNKGILPITNLNTSNLHSIGQYLQEGTKVVFETVWKIQETNDLELDNYNISLNNLNNLVADQVALAHAQGDTPSIIVTLKELTAYEIGKFIYFLETAAAIGGYLLEIDPFNQPGVEAYKKLVNKELEQYKK